MGRIEERNIIGRNKKRWNSGSLRDSFVVSFLIYCFIGLAGAIGTSLLTTTFCKGFVKAISLRFHLDQPLDDYIQREFPFLGLLEWMSEYGIYLFLMLAMVLVVLFYYRQKVLPILSAVSELADQVQAGELESTISWKGSEELGQVCVQMEEMRKLLVREKQKQWEVSEEQRKINGAFAHDIRTPLTVMKGYTEFLEKYLPQDKLTKQQVLDRLAIIREQEDRLLAFSKTMTTIQTLEERQVQGKSLLPEDVMKAIEKQIEGIRQNTAKRIYLRRKENRREGNKKPDSAFWGDESMILEVMENLLDNALRYAKAKVEILVEFEFPYLRIFVLDDGPGFTDKGLVYASDAYYREENGGEHFGLGLAASRIICERHGGALTLVNGMEEGAIVTAIFGISVENL